ncbi:MAG TPA: hypothetical protein DD435_12100 [Cyanobacteria bacterium UBA8530]|nr:hypothetical protein [Cyanobacteria bacterium UBA8530]
MRTEETKKENLVAQAYEMKKEGWRLVCITGTDLSTDSEQKMEVLYHFARENEVRHLRVETDGTENYPSILSAYANALFLENELKEMLGIPVDGIKGELLLRLEDEVKAPLKRLRGVSYETREIKVEKNAEVAPQ